MKNNGLLSVIACCACTLAMFMTSCAKKVYIPAQDTTVSTPTTPKLPNGEVELITFCIDDAYDKPGEYMAGEDYSKDTNVPAGKKMYERSLEGGAKAIGTKVIDKYANAVCRKFTQSATGGYVGYVAVHVLLEDAKKGLAEELEVRKVDYDKKKFFEKMDQELAASAAKQKEEVDAMK